MIKTLKVGIIFAYAAITASNVSAQEVNMLSNSSLRSTAEMQKYLETRIDKTAKLKTLLSADGQNVDCVDINRQPAMQNPLLRGHKVEPIPNVGHRLLDVPANSITKVDSLFEKTMKGSRGNAASCPEGSVPILEVSTEKLKKFNSLNHFFSKSPDGNGSSPTKYPDEKLVTLTPISAIDESPPTEDQPPPSGDHIGPKNTHQYAHAYQNINNFGGFAWFSLYYNSIYRDNEFSLSQVWITSGTGATLESVEAGIQKYPLLYSNYSNHLFIYSTRGGYAPNTGCYNGTCADFIQTSTKIFPGMKLEYGYIDLPPKEIKIEWTNLQGNWWLVVDNIYVGYYPRTLFKENGLRKLATAIDFGGEILDLRNANSPGHTLTTMGSGRFPSEGYKRAAYIRKMKYYDYADNPPTGPVFRTFSDLKNLIPWTNDASCYDVKVIYSPDPEFLTMIYFGGPGNSVIPPFFNCL